MKKRINGLISLWLAAAILLSSVFTGALAVDAGSRTVKIYTGSNFMYQGAHIAAADCVDFVFTPGVALDEQALPASVEAPVGWHIWEASEDSDSFVLTSDMTVVDADAVMESGDLSPTAIYIFDPIYSDELEVYRYSGEDALREGEMIDYGSDYTKVGIKPYTALNTQDAFNVTRVGSALDGWNVWLAVGSGYLEHRTVFEEDAAPTYSELKEYTVDEHGNFSDFEKLIFEPIWGDLYWFIHQPTADDPSVEVNLPEDVSSYQWLKLSDRQYAADERAVQAFDGASYGTPGTSSYDAQSGKWIPALAGSTAAYFTAELKAGDLLIVKCGLPVEGAPYIPVLLDSSAQKVIISSYNGSSFVARAPSDGTYIAAAMLSSASDELTAQELAVSAKIRTVDETPVEGKTSAALGNADAGIYACRVTFENGAVLTSEQVLVADVPTYSFNGTVREAAHGAVSATLQVLTDHGTVSAVTDGTDGSFTFPELPAGMYNVHITLNDLPSNLPALPPISFLRTFEIPDNETTVDFTFDADSPCVSSQFIAPLGAPRIVIGGLDAEATFHVNGTDFSITSAAAEIVTDTEDTAKIIAESGNDNHLFFELNMGTFGEQSGFADIAESAALQFLFVPFDTENSENISVWRVHNGNVETFTAADEDADATFSVSDGFVLIRADKFSTYAIGYDTKKNENQGQYIPSGGGGGSYGPKYTVTFDTDGGSEIKAQSVYHGKTVSRPIAPTKSGFIFDGWYKDEALTEAYEFGKGVAQSFTLYAKWRAASTPDTSGGAGDGLPFIDVEKGDWFYGYVKQVYEKGIMNGTSKVHFSPNMLITRAMFCTILYRLEGSPEVSGESRFSDYDKNAYYADAMLWAEQNKIIKGYTPTEVRPDGNVLREQISAILHRYATYKGIDTSAHESADISAYTDTALIDGYALPTMKWAIGLGLINGKTATTLDPDGFARRSEIAAIICRYLETVK